MCGICGVVQIEGASRPVVAPHVLDAMTDVMTHRGPSDRGVFMDDGIALGVRRLSIVDVADGHQPVTDEAGSVHAIQNGELYNHLELRDRLAPDGHRFRSRCDTEILPHLYERHGASFPEQLRGKFAVAVWDADRRRAVIARDRLGVKPLYWARSGDLLVFASELKSVLASGLVAGELDYEAIELYLTLGYVPGPRSPLAGVRKLLPGHRLVVEDGGIEIERYWAYPEPRPGPTAPGVDDYAASLLESLDEAVRLRLMSDVPLGAMLSGGLDSSLVVALMARHTSEPVKTFSIGFAEAPETSELADARLVARAFGTEHHELELSFTSDTVELEELVWSLDEPLADLSALGLHALSELAARHVTVALSGQGADELVGGYRKHQAASICAAWDRLPGPVRALGARTARVAPRRLARPARTLAARDPAERLLAMSSILEDEARTRLFRGPLAAGDGTAARRAVRSLLAGVATEDALALTLYLDAQLALVDDMLHYFDRTSMAHSLEVRVPFLDHRVVELCARIPPSFKVRRLDRKHVLKRAARGLVPDEILDKRKVGFFRHEVDAWLAAQMYGAVPEYLCGAHPRCAELLDAGEVELLVRAHPEGGGGNRHLLLAVLMLEIWLSTYLPRALAPAAPARERIRVAR